MLTGMDRAIWWELGLLGVTLLNVIEGGKKRATVGRRQVDVASILEALPEAVVLLDENGRIVKLNKPTERLIGQPREGLLGQSGASLVQERLNGLDDFDALVRRALRGEPVRTGQLSFCCPNGDTIRVVVSASPIADQTGQVSGVLLAVQDVTELAALQKQSDNNERHVAVGQMTAGMVHDFNNVLNTITEAVAVLEHDRKRSDSDRTILGIIGNAVHYGAQTVRNTRDYLIGSRQKPMLIDVRALLDEVLELTHPVLKPISV